MAEQNLGVLGELKGLQHLHLVIASNGNWQQDTLDWLQPLSMLSELDLSVRGMGHRPLLLPASFGALRGLAVLDLTRESSGGDFSYSTSNISEVVSKLISLRRLSLKGIVDQFPGALSNLTNLEFCALEGADDGEWPRLGDESAPLLDYPGEQYVTMIMPAPHWLLTCQALACLPHLTDISLDTVDLSRVSKDDWAFSTHLQSLSLAECGMDYLPTALLALTSLLDLSIAYNPVTELPAGPYLKHLTSLDLCGISFPEVPQALCKASSLQILEFLESGMAECGSLLEAMLPQGCRLELLDD